MAHMQVSAEHQPLVDQGAALGLDVATIPTLIATFGSETIKILFSAKEAAKRAPQQGILDGIPAVLKAFLVGALTSRKAEIIQKVDQIAVEAVEKAIDAIVAALS